MKALILFLLFLLPSCSVFHPVVDPVTTKTERLVEGYTPSGTPDLKMQGGYTQSVINVDSFPGRISPYNGTNTPLITHSASESKNGLQGVYMPTYLDRDTISIVPTDFHEYHLVSFESPVTMIQVNITRSIITGYSYDSNGRQTEFILSFSLSPWHRDNEKVYDTAFGPMRIVTDPTIFLPYHGRISLGQWEWIVK